MKHATLARIQILLEQCESLQHAVRAASMLLADARVSERDRLVAASEVLAASAAISSGQAHETPSARTLELLRELQVRLENGQ